VGAARPSHRGAAPGVYHFVSLSGPSALTSPSITSSAWPLTMASTGAGKCHCFIHCVTVSLCHCPSFLTLSLCHCIPVRPIRAQISPSITWSAWPPTMTSRSS